MVLADNEVFDKNTANSAAGTSIMRPTFLSRLASTPAKGIAAAAGVHFVGLAVLAGMHLPKVADAVVVLINIGAAQKSIQLTLSESEADTPLFELSLSQQEVLITPDWMEVAGQRFVDLPAAEVTLPQWEHEAENPRPSALSEFSLEELSEIRPPPSTDVTAIESPSTESHEPDENISHASQPDLSGNRYPSYPDHAQRMRWQGTVVVRLFIDSRGHVTDVEIAESSGYELLDSAAVNACRSWRGQPAMRADRPVETIALQPITFRLP